MKLKLITLLTFCSSVLFAFVLPGKQDVTAKIENNTLEVTYHIPKGMHQILQKKYFDIKIKKVKGLKFSETIYPTPDEVTEYGKEYIKPVVLKKEIKATAEYLNKKPIEIEATYQLCNDSGACLPPHTENILIKTKDIKLTPVEADEKVQFKELAYMLLLAFLGGIILNLMPCVLPVLSIKMLSIVNSCHNTRKEILKESLLYTAGILISFILLAFTVIILKESGEAVGWGFQFQNPSFVFGLLLIIWVFSLSLFDLYLIELPGMSLANGVGSKSGGMGTFLSGVFAVLLATPCTAPLLGTAIGFAFQSPPIVIFLTMLLIGLGMAMPFILLSLVPNITKFVPKPGNWMNNFRVCMGFTLIATSIFLLRTLSYMVSIENLVNILWFLLIISFIVWVYGKLSSPRYSKKVRWLALASAILLSFFTGKLLLNLEYSTNDCDQSSAIKEHYIKFSEKQLNEYLSEKRKVFIVFGAQWCMTCKLNERGALSKEAVLDAFTKNDVALMYGDFTRKSPELLSYLHKFNRSGVPFYIYYDPSAKDPVILPEVITEKMILKLLQGKK